MIADVENKYYQVAEDGSGTQPVTRGPYFKVSVALLCGAGLALLSIVTHSGSEPASFLTSGTASTNLVGLSSVLHPSGGVVKSSIISTMGRPALPGSSPFKQIALSALEANNLQNRVRDVSMMSSTLEKDLEYLSGVTSADDKTKAAVAEMKNAVVEKAKGWAGVTAPLGFFDPLGFTTSCNEGKLLFYREVEVKHGRVAMLASLGFLVAEQFHPLFGGNIGVPSYIAFQATPLQTFWPAVVAALAVPEIQQINAFKSPFSENGEKFSIRSDRVPGNFGFDPLGLKPTNPKEFKDMLTKEINNG